MALVQIRNGGQDVGLGVKGVLVEGRTITKTDRLITNTEKGKKVCDAWKSGFGQAPKQLKTEMICKRGYGGHF